MIDPIFALSVFATIAAILAIVFWPVRGLFWYWQRVYWKSELVDVEDALKHVYNCEYTSRPSTVDSLAGCLSITTDRAVDLVQRLDELDLLVTKDNTFHLTTSGREAALRVIRIHRLWERYLADRTGLKESTWHAFADRREHSTSPREVEALSARLGSPRFDPHGDPIPLPDGQMPAERGIALTKLGVGQSATIVHVEDEPDAIYAQLVAEGLHPGMVIRVIESAASRIRFDADGEEVVLAPIVAASIAVVPISVHAHVEEPFERLSNLQISERGKVVGISPACRGSQMRRLLDLGFVQGTEVEAELLSPGGDPTAYRVRGALIALRKDQAKLVYITRMGKGGPDEREL